MLMKKNKKAYSTQLFGMFFILFIFSSLFFFLTFGMHYILYDYGIGEVTNVAESLLSDTAAIEALGDGFLGLTGFYDILFLFLLVSLFIESTIAAIKTKESGFMSFFGFVTLGNVFLIFILSYASQVQGWLLNEIIFKVILITIQTPVLTTFFNNSMYIALFWYLWLIGVNQINLPGVKERFDETFNKGRGNTQENFQDEAIEGFKE